MTAAGRLSQQHPAGGPGTFTCTLDALERPTQMTDSSSKTWASGVTYNAANQPLYDGTATRTYNNLLQFFLDPVQGNNANLSVGQGTVLVHELLHFATQLDDNAFVGTYGIALQGETASSAISRWLQSNCNN